MQTEERFPDQRLTGKESAWFGWRKPPWAAAVVLPEVFQAADPAESTLILPGK